MPWDELLRDPSLREELEALRERWWVVCDVRISQRGRRELPLDEALAAEQWCVELAAELVDADRAIAEGRPTSPRLDYWRRETAERFANLDAGLRSNGTARRRSRE